jgi:hypothetical protein
MVGFQDRAPLYIQNRRNNYLQVGGAFIICSKPLAENFKHGFGWVVLKAACSMSGLSFAGGQSEWLSSIICCLHLAQLGLSNWASVIPRLVRSLTYCAPPYGEFIDLGGAICRAVPFCTMPHAVLALHGFLCASIFDTCSIASVALPVISLTLKRLDFFQVI